jgi:TRAP-type C4-dicarboxylate transport system substrate-binding protein
MNKAKWNSMPPDIRKIFTEVNNEWIEKTGKLWDEIDKDGIDFITKRGVKITSLSKEEDARWAEAMKPLSDEYLRDTAAKGLPGNEALKFCQDWIKANQK